MKFPEEYSQAVSEYLDAKQIWLNAVSDYNDAKLGKTPYEMKKMAFHMSAGRFAEASLKLFCDAVDEMATEGE